MISQLAFGTYVLDAVGVKAAERLAIVADADRAETANAVAAQARERGLSVTVVVTHDDYQRERDMPPAAIAAIDESDVALLFVGYARVQFGGHADFRKRATQRAARVGFVTRDRSEGEAADLAEAAKRTRYVADLLTGAERALVTTSAGAHLEFDLRGRSARALTNELADPGAWGALPDFFEAAIAPIEGASSGRAVIDGTSLVSGIVRDRFDIAVTNGIVAPLGRGDDVEALRAYLEAAGENGTNLAELGIGTSTLADAGALTGTFEDKKIAGTAHLGIGDNRGLGGVTAASIHTDVQLLAVTIELDGRPIVTRGTLRLP